VFNSPSSADHSEIAPISATNDPRGFIDEMRDDDDSDRPLSQDSGEVILLSVTSVTAVLGRKNIKR